MFGVDSTELAVVAILALIFIGPKDLPKVMRVVGYWIGRVRGGGLEFQYKDATSTTGHAKGTGASIGVENVNGLEGLPYSFDSGSVTFPLNITKSCN